MQRSHLVQKQAYPQPAPPPTLQRVLENVEAAFTTFRVVQLTRFGVIDCLTYPCTVFCRQCQVYPYNNVRPSVFSPVNTLLVLHRIGRSQGMQAWWRGLYSHLTLLLARPFSEVLLGRFFNLPFPPSPHHLEQPGASSSSISSFSSSSWRDLLKTLLVKSISGIFTMPLICYVFMEMVQSTTHKVYNGLLEVLRERALVSVSENHQLPYLFLIGPTVLRGLAADCVSYVMNRRVFPSSDSVSTRRALLQAFFSSLVVDSVLYPLETVLVRLYCQGVPALVDNVQVGSEVTFVHTYYRGLLDCVLGVWESEGPWGFYKGFSSMFLQYLIYGAVVALICRYSRSHWTRDSS